MAIAQDLRSFDVLCQLASPILSRCVPPLPFSSSWRTQRRQLCIVYVRIDSGEQSLDTLPPDLVKQCVFECETFRYTESNANFCCPPAHSNQIICSVLTSYSREPYQNKPRALQEPSFPKRKTIQSYMLDNFGTSQADRDYITDKKCIEHHVFDEVTQQCEYMIKMNFIVTYQRASCALNAGKHDPKFCGELITNDGWRKMIEIPSKLMVEGLQTRNVKYDFDYWTNASLKEENFHVAITEVIVRQHCWMTLKLWPGEGIQNGNPRVHKSLETAGYGKHQVKSYYNGLFTSRRDSQPRKRKTRCAADHALNEETGTGPKDACMQMIDYTGVADFVRMPKLPQQTAMKFRLVGTRWNEVVCKVVVRQGCMYSGFGGNANTFDRIVLGKNNLGYGEHWVPNF
ncbi:hypothetical protein PRIPAC_93682 [Pristionchus pacificus]|uniref:Uncharacterized protein n=1 Tax=Pristionchus pacificus TaxID=54126 RepID=A0A2A6CIG7_PRIPA|nr:hypothetical protein PRIPAC_93682 [Pristionchus pacificus]|eukprot:PDM77853.1 hypothetical protein PRIPAC_34720 [Pristionchus pacificus]